MERPLITPDQVSALEAAFAGGALSLLFQGKVTWWRALLVFTSGEVCAFYATAPFARATGWNEGVIGLSVGFAAMFFCTGAVNWLTKFSADPMATLRAIPFLRAFLGQEDNHGGDAKP